MNKRETIIKAVCISIFLVLSFFITFFSFETNDSEGLLLIPFMAGIFIYIHEILQEDDDELL